MTKGYSRTLLFTVLFLFFTAVPLLSEGADEIPQILKGKDGQISLHLPGTMAAVLKSFDPEFNEWKLSDYPGWFTELYEYDRNYAPYAITGDDNEDGTLDAVVEGHNGKHDKSLALLSNKGSFQVIIVRNGSPKYFSSSPNLALSKAPPGLYLSPVDDETLEFKKDGFGIVVVGKGISSIYYYDKGEFKSLLTGG